MYQRAITLEQFADIHEQLEVYGRTDTGPVMTTTGVHPDLGSIVVIQDIAPGLILLSELPFLHGPSQEA
jgi:hypothetical protein